MGKRRFRARRRNTKMCNMEWWEIFWVLEGVGMTGYVVGLILGHVTTK
jgi:hypothetical protein